MMRQQGKALQRMFKLIPGKELPDGNGGHSILGIRLINSLDSMCQCYLGKWSK